MNKLIGIALLAGGIVMLVFGFQAKRSLNDRIVETIKGAPTDKTTWMLAGGAAATVAGLAMVMLKGGGKS